MLSGELDVELIPQGTLAERCRAAQSGFPRNFYPAGFGTEVAVGKETREFDGKTYVLERAFKADFSFVKAWKGDTAGNLIFKGTARNFNPNMCVLQLLQLLKSRTCPSREFRSKPYSYSWNFCSKNC